MHQPGADTILLRHDEIGANSEQVRRKIESQLRDNVGAALADVATEVTLVATET